VGEEFEPRYVGNAWDVRSDAASDYEVPLRWGEPDDMELFADNPPPLNKAVAVEADLGDVQVLEKAGPDGAEEAFENEQDSYENPVAEEAVPIKENNDGNAAGTENNILAQGANEQGPALAGVEKENIAEEDKSASEKEDYGSQEAFDDLANDPVFMARPPSVRGRSPGLEASVNEMLARYAAPKVRFEDGARRHSADLSDAESDDYLEPELPKPEAPQPARRGARSRQNRRGDDDDWKPNRPDVRKRRGASESSPAVRPVKRQRTKATTPSPQTPIIGPNNGPPPSKRRGRPPKNQASLPVTQGPGNRATEPSAPGNPTNVFMASIPATNFPLDLQQTKQAAFKVAPGVNSITALGPLPPNDTSQPAKKPYKRPVAELDDNGQPVKRKRKPPAPKLDENGQPIKKDREGKRSEGADPAAPMQSTEGEQMTRAEFYSAYKRDQRLYHPGGPRGAGKYEVVATGVMWSFLQGRQDHSQRTSTGRESGGENPAATKGRKKAVKAGTATAPVMPRNGMAPAAPAAGASPSVSIANGVDTHLIRGADASLPAGLAVPNGPPAPTGMTVPVGMVRPTAPVTPGASTTSGGQFPGINLQLQPGIQALRAPPGSSFASHEEPRQLVAARFAVAGGLANSSSSNPNQIGVNQPAGGAQGLGMGPAQSGGQL
jgi:hypothetical protein